MGLIYTRIGPKKKKQRKPTKKQIEAQAAFVELQARLDALPKFADRNHSTSNSHVSKQRKSKRGEAEIYRSQCSAQSSEAELVVRRQKRYLDEVGTVPKKESPKYTGTKVKGIGQMHKSNAVPVFNDEEAIDLAKMRRN